MEIKREDERTERVREMHSKDWETIEKSRPTLVEWANNLWNFIGSIKREWSNRIAYFHTIQTDTSSVVQYLTELKCFKITYTNSYEKLSNIGIAFLPPPATDNNRIDKKLFMILIYIFK